MCSVHTMRLLSVISLLVVASKPHNVNGQFGAGTGSRRSLDGIAAVFSTDAPTMESATDVEENASNRKHRNRNSDVTFDDAALSLQKSLSDEPTAEQDDYTDWGSSSPTALATGRPTLRTTGIPTEQVSTKAPSSSSSPTQAPTSANTSTSTSTTNEPTVGTPPRASLPTSSPFPTPSPTDDCVDINLNLDGNDVDLKGYCRTLRFEYEVELHPNTSLFTLEQFLLPAIEEAIMAKSLRPLLVKACDDENSTSGESGNMRRFLTENGMAIPNSDGTLSNRHRRMTIFGVSASPPDLRKGTTSPTDLQPTQSCTNPKTSVMNRCSKISGACTVCSTAIETDKMEVLGAIQESMEEDAYIGAHEDIVKIYFVGDEDESINDGEYNMSTTEVPVDTENPTSAENDGSEDVADEEDPDSDSDPDPDQHDRDQSGQNEDKDDQVASTKPSSSSSSNTETDNTPVTGLSGMKLWGVILGSVSGLVVFIAVGRKLTDDCEEYEEATKEDEKADSETSSDV